jgi:hypothetical protein
MSDSVPNSGPEGRSNSVHSDQKLTTFVEISSTDICIWIHISCKISSWASVFISQWFLKECSRENLNFMLEQKMGLEECHGSVESDFSIWPLR